MRLSLQAESRLIRLTAAACGVTFVLYFFKVWFFEGANDYEVYYRASQRLLSGQWDHLYTSADGYGQLRYSPATFPLYAWLSLFPFKIARALWYLVNVAGYAGGFALLYRTLQAVRASARAITALAILGTLRFMMDSFTIGQISGIMFFGLALGLWGWMLARPAWMAAGIFIPAAIKIGLGVVYPLAFQRGARFVLTGLGVTVALIGGAFALDLGVAGGWSGFTQMLEAWVAMLGTVLRSDSQDYWDCAHYGSQAINSALLRMAEWKWMEGQTARTLWLVSAYSGVAGLLAFWVLRHFETPRGRGLAFGLGVMAYLILMPFTSKYSIPFAAIPVAFLLMRWEGFWVRGSLIFGVFMLSLAGKDIIGDWAFFGMQKASFPALALVFITTATAVEAWRESTWRWAPSRV